MLSAMRYKDFTWPHNPRTFHAVWQRRVAVLDAPEGRFEVQDLGRTSRIFRGEGEFYGPAAYATFEKLASVFAQDGCATLEHPIWYCPSAYFTTLELTQEPRQDYVAYAFVFTETREGTLEATRRAGIGESYQVRSGDTLWSVASAYGMDISALLRKNPRIYNPNILIPGQEILVG